MVLALPMLLALTGCGDPPERGALYLGERLPVTDMHLHPGEWEEIPSATRRFLASRFPFPFSLQPQALAEQVLSAEGILEQMDEAGVERALLYAVYAPRTVGVASNELIMEQVAVDPARLVGLASLSVDDWLNQEQAQLDALRAALGQPGMVGIKLAHAHQHFRMDDPRYFSIYRLAAELGKPVYLHTGTSPFPGTSQEPPYTDPAWLEEAIRNHPQTAFILGHLGYDFTAQAPGALQTCLDLAARYPNVWLEPSALGSAGSDPTGENLPAAYRAIRDAGLVGRTIYGSDGPQRPGFVKDYLERSLLAMEASGYTAEEAAQVLDGNFQALFLPDQDTGGTP